MTVQNADFDRKSKLKRPSCSDAICVKNFLMKTFLAFHVKIHTQFQIISFDFNVSSKIWSVCPRNSLDSGTSWAILCVFNAIFRSLLTISSSMMS